jgi:hypothetical protein
MISGWIKGIFSLFTAIFYFCCNPSPSPPLADFYNEPIITKQKMTVCNSALEHIKNRDFINWTGLPANCDWTPLVGALPTEWARIPERSLGSNFLRGKMLMANVEGYMRASFSFVEGKPVLFEAMGPKLQASVADLMERFGTPKAILDWDFGTLPCPASEYVYPDKGVTLFLGTDKAKVFHIALYAATTLEDYLENLRPKLGKKRLPRH